MAMLIATYSISQAADIIIAKNALKNSLQEKMLWRQDIGHVRYADHKITNQTTALFLSHKGHIYNPANNEHRPASFYSGIVWVASAPVPGSSMFFSDAIAASFNMRVKMR